MFLSKVKNPSTISINFPPKKCGNWLLMEIQLQMQLISMQKIGLTLTAWLKSLYSISQLHSLGSNIFWGSSAQSDQNLYSYTDGCKMLHTILVKHYNDLLETQRSEQGKDEVTFFYVGDVLCIHLGSRYTDFQIHH